MPGSRYPEPWITLGMLAGLDTNLRLGTLVSPVTFREPGIIAKTVATLDVLTNGRAFCGLGAGWWLREHQAYGLDFPNDRQRLDRLQVCIETLRALRPLAPRPTRTLRSLTGNHLLPTAGRRRTDHRRRLRGTPDAEDRRRAGRWLQLAVG